MKTICVRGGHIWIGGDAPVPGGLFVVGDRIERLLSPADADTASASVDEIQMASKVFHRARLTNLSQEQAVDGCKRLEKKKIYCSAIQVTAWNTPGAR